MGTAFGLCGSSALSFLLFDQQPCNDHEVIRQDGGSHKKFESLPALRETALHATTAGENRDPPLYAGTETLGLFKGGAFLVGCLRRTLPSTALGYAHEFYPGFLAQLEIGFAEKPAIRTIDGWHITKCFRVMLQRGFDVTIIRGVL